MKGTGVSDGGGGGGGWWEAVGSFPTIWYRLKINGEWWQELIW